MDKVTALIIAAGSGSRMGEGVPKQFRPIGGKSVLRHAAEAMTRHPRVDAVRVVIGAGQEAHARDSLAALEVGELIVGGRERAESVANGLAAIDGEIVLVHDAARPFCPSAVVDRLLDALVKGNHGAVPALAVVDTLAKGDA
ncbi:MAG: 2-C-methyl-D-erythritol 4-phosphate cytidylyltransferase, partial [Pseudomonadota bacterium]|nr:2-C-methyl-D-erythritol 4-phosphate cytidylyltransferase [Pseudomonadota bacterium]